MIIFRKLSKHLSNIPGWSTSRKIVVFESDDWGSIRMTSPEAFARMKSKGLKVDKDRYHRYDALESNRDMEALLDVLSGFSDRNGNPAIFTNFQIVANPDFEKIKANNFREYFREPFSETLKRYPQHDRVMELTREGMEKGLLFPEFHGREHLNISRWMRALQNGHPATLIAFENGVTGINARVAPDMGPAYQAAFDVDEPKEIKVHRDILRDGLTLFEEQFGRRARFFVPPNYILNKSLNTTLAEEGVFFITTGKKSLEPVGGGKFKNSFRYSGMSTGCNRQIYMTRNCLFEPNESPQKDWVGSCMKDIQTAFQWNKPAVISTHRINYAGFMDPANRDFGIRLLKELLQQITLKWPEVEFLSSTQLGKLILASKKLDFPQELLATE